MVDYKDAWRFCGGPECNKIRVCVETGRRLDYLGTTRSEWTAGVAFLVALIYWQDLVFAGLAAIAAYFLVKLKIVQTIMSVVAVIVLVWIFGSAFGLIDWNPFTSLLRNQ